MKTDRELLELAAKAAGYAIEWREWITSSVAEFGAIKHTKHKGFWLDNKQWNPLTDDGDALRLAVKLKMSVEISEHDESSFAYAGSGIRVYGCENWSGDNGAATRRAITRAAAAIGERMK